MDKQRFGIEVKEIERLNNEKDKVLYRLYEFFERGLSIETIENMESERLNNMIAERERMLEDRERQTKAMQDEEQKKRDAMFKNKR